MISEQTWKFIAEHRFDDVRRLALSSSFVDMPAALQQIAGWQTARKKLPTWAATDGIVFPPRLNMEQCSSESAARYKAKIVSSGNRFVDLTGGMGVDCWALSEKFRETVYVEQNEMLCQLASVNMPLLGRNVEVVHADAVEYLAEMPHADLVFVDPSRRDANGFRTYGITDCVPNVAELLPVLLQRSDAVMLKLSPMLDWHKAIADLDNRVSQVHVVSIGGECKELLLVAGREKTVAPRMFCVDDNSVFSCTTDENCVASIADGIGPGQWLLVPNASVMKAGCFAQLSARYHVNQVARQSHLFIADGRVQGFPGRQFCIVGTSTMNKHEVMAMLNGVKSANISVRNFPMSAEQLRRRLRLEDGGDNYIFATSLADGSHVLLLCRRAVKNEAD